MCDKLSESDSVNEANWKLLLNKHYSTPKYNNNFKHNLLEKLRKQQSTTYIKNITNKDLIHTDNMWRDFLFNTYENLAISSLYTQDLKNKLRIKQKDLYPAQDLLVNNLISVFTPVVPEDNFKENLLKQLKNKQKTTIIAQKRNRRFAIYTSFYSTLAAAAVILFVVTFFSFSQKQDSNSNLAEVILPTETFSSDTLSEAPIVAVAESVKLPSLIASDIFKNSSFSNNNFQTIGLELNKSNSWQELSDNNLFTQLEPGVSFKANNNNTSGLAFSDGTRIILWPEAVITSTNNGFSINQGKVAIRVPDTSTSPVCLSFSDREISVQPGTDLLVNSYFPADYAIDGAPAPEVKVFAGGFVVSKNDLGFAPMFAGQAYKLDNYTTADLPARSLLPGEYYEVASFASNNGSETRQVNFSPNIFKIVDNFGMSKIANRWQPEYYNSQPTVKIKYLSDEYFGLANQRRDLAKYFSFGSNVIIDAGNGIFYEIYD